jgi:hypothetical protein
MKRLVKKVLRIGWRWTSPLRAPVARKFESYLKGCLKHEEWFLTDQTSVLMDHLIRELVRLQRQVDYLQQTIEERAAIGARPMIAGELDATTDGDGERLKAG